MPVHADLQQAFAMRADGVQTDGVELVGTFGEGVPRALIASLGGLAVDIKAPPLSDARDAVRSPIVESIAEPFLDTFATSFLHRFAAGAFDRFATLIFARDDVAALAAYQYALELRRQGRLPDRGPRMYLWNLLHTDTAPVAAFNRAELERLTDHLVETLGTGLDPNRLSEAVKAERRRMDALHALPPGGPDAFVARNAGRWLTPEAHGALLSDLSAGEGPRIALVGTACDIPVMHALCEGLGQVVADLQDYGRLTEQPCRAADLLTEVAEDPLSPRAGPPARFTRALHDGIAGADLVIASVDRNDDSFGWELPGLRQAAAAQGARFLDLGFRPFRPDPAWQDDAKTRIAETLS
ncbi:2-hydroxyacyl-CoA dehydratase family protein [Primorskyibacter sp. 2E233]|uniref:2-hydroxyacyl-CoA dehydratase family protein n=1 Tax=Primorskyibacter sp. 2E233 TaxID=3413431 RepID=UPI003BF0E997